MPQRGCIPQPKVAKLPWVDSKPYTNPEWVVFLARCNPFRVGSILLSIPKVAHSSQPWAVGLIPFGDSWKIFVLHPKKKMWIVGGDVNQGYYMSDVWNSEDGVGSEECDCQCDLSKAFDRVGRAKLQELAEKWKYPSGPLRLSRTSY